MYPVSCLFFRPVCSNFLRMDYSQFTFLMTIISLEHLQGRVRYNEERVLLAI